MLTEKLPLYAEACLRLVFPAHCGACNTLLELSETAVCGRCADRLEREKLSFNETFFPESLEFIEQAWSIYPYADTAKDLLTGIKFEGKRWLIKAFENSLHEMALALCSEYHYDLLVPIPLSRLKYLEREFNQADLIAEQVSRASRIPVEKTALKKHHTVVPQSALSHHERIAGTFGVFELKKAGTIQGKNVLLIDDIITTGSTADEAARILKKEGARRADLLTLARTELHS